MSLFTRSRRQVRELTAADLIPGRPIGDPAGVVVDNSSALRHSAVWACLMLRANLVSTFPVDAFRQVGDLLVEQPKPPILVAPGGDEMDMHDWMFATQLDLDRCGNAFGLISQRNGYGLPARIDLVEARNVTVVHKDGVKSYRISGKTHPADEVYHERQYVAPGLPMGLSPVANAARVIGQYESAADFAIAWYTSGGIPKAHLRNTALAKIDQSDAALAKERFLAAVQGRGLFVTGAEWEYKPIQAENVGSEWLDSQKSTLLDIARYFSCPGDLIDAPVDGSTITYANVVQRNLQFLTLHLQPAITRREKNLSKLIPSQWIVKLNTDALLRMDPQTRAGVMDTRIKNHTLTVTEARALDNLPPLTQAQIDEFSTLGALTPKPMTPAAIPNPAGSPDA